MTLPGAAARAPLRPKPTDAVPALEARPCQGTQALADIRAGRRGATTDWVAG
jgi:hypothetical protein